MFALGKQMGRGVFFILGASLLSTAAFADPAPIDPYAPPAPPVVIAPPAAAPAPAPAPSGQGNGSGSPGQTASGGSSNSNNTNNIQANPTNNNTANQNNTSTNNNTNDNRSSATATNNNTIYIYPPAIPTPAPPTSISPPPLPPPLVPPPAPGAYAAPYYRPQRIRLNCAQLCAPPPLIRPPLPIAPVQRERIRPIAIGLHVTALGMANQPLTGWGTLGGAGFHITMRNKGRFGFEIAQDFLRGTYRAGDGGNSITRNSYPVDFTFRGYILPNLDKHHFNVYFGGGFGVMGSTLRFEGPYGETSQSFLEWSIHGDVGAELRFKWIALGVDTKVMGIVRDRFFGSGRYYDGVQDGVVPAKTWGLQGRGYLSFWF
jgi:hypothetical protein